MANTLSTTGISSNSIIKPEHISQSIDAFTGVEAYDITLSGSLFINGTLNLDTPPTGNLISHAAYSVSASYALNAVTASNTLYADVSYDTLTIQLGHGVFENPISSSIYYFDLIPTTASILDLLPSDPERVTGIHSPKASITILSASVSTTVQGTLASTENSGYRLYASDTNISNLPSLPHSTNFTSSLKAIGYTITNPNLKIYMQWSTPSWSTSPTQVSHNVVLYCTRNYDIV
jgi:hypothetical protein